MRNELEDRVARREERQSAPGPVTCPPPGRPRVSWPHLLQRVLVQLVQVECVDALLGPHHQELVCQCGRGVRGQRSATTLAQAQGCPAPTTSSPLAYLE